MRTRGISMPAFPTPTAVLLALAVAALAVFAPSADAKDGKKKGGKPDLIVQGQATTLQEYLLRGEDGTVGFSDRTANIGKGKAKPSRTALVLIHAPEVDRTPVASRPVPKLKPGKSDFGVGSETSSVDLVPGSYFAFVCADIHDKVKEKKEGNNCLSLEQQVYVAERAWFGQLNGSGPVQDGVTETWSSDDASFVFSEYLGDGRFKYSFAGTLRYSVSGTDSEGCSWSGSDATGVSGATGLPGNGSGEGIILDHRKEEYFGTLGVAGFPFTWLRDCPYDGLPPEEYPGPLNLAGGFIVVNPQEVDTQPLPFGSTTITGSSTEEFNGSTFGWLLG